MKNLLLSRLEIAKKEKEWVNPFIELWKVFRIMQRKKAYRKKAWETWKIEGECLTMLIKGAIVKEIVTENFLAVNRYQATGSWSANTTQ